MAGENGTGFSDFEREAMRRRAKEISAEKRSNKKRAEGEQAVLRAIEEMSGTDREIGARIHKIASEVAPDLWPKTWYGFPAYSVGGKKVVFFYQSAEKAEERYATLGFTGLAKLDDGRMWPTSYAIDKIGPTEEKFIRELLARAVSEGTTGQG